jgi:hypothetical protein
MPKAFLLKRKFKEEEGLPDGNEMNEDGGDDEDTDEEDSWRIGRGA